jgi:16S rRNA (adenine1518-N6/adenine1519-N6)-dimethyltransferase
MPASPRRRAFGQHFLRDEKVISQIVTKTFEFVEKYSARSLLEIGPGKGAITHPILGRVKSAPTLEQFLIVEKDRNLAAEWIEQTRESTRIKVIEADFLNVESTNYLQHCPLVVVSNLPYSSGTAILQDLAKFPDQIPAMVLMFQAEVAARLRAVPREKAWGSLGLWVQNRWDVKKLLSVPPGAFVPPPDVNSEVVVLEARSEPRIPGSLDDPNWEKLIRIPFLHRRKMLRSGLPKGSIWKEALEAAGIDGTRRAEDLEWEDWGKWLKAVRSIKSDT